MATWEDDQILEDQYEDYQESQTHGLSRLATCTSSSTLDYENFDNIDDDNHGTLGTMFSGLSIESFDVGGDADADQEFCNEVYGPDVQETSLRGCLFLNSDDDKEPPTPAWYSLPASPLHEQRCQPDDLSKQYLSDNNCGKLCTRKKKVLRRKKCKERKTSKSDMNDEDDENSVEMKMNLSLLSNNSFSGESEGGLRVITRPKGGKRALCMDMEEVKACRDLGFELEHQQMFDLTTTPTRLTLSAPSLDTITTSSGGSSPIPNWRISSPGDAPKDVKARLKVWAQAVALASSSSWRHLTS